MYIKVLYRIENSIFLIEYSLGISLMSNASMDRAINSGILYFNHILGAGVKYKKVKLIAKYQHYSNNGISHPNIGANFVFINLGWNYTQ